jgi:hypothetical protein
VRALKWFFRIRGSVQGCLTLSITKQALSPGPVPAVDPYHVVVHKEIQEDENKGPAGKCRFPQFEGWYRKRSLKVIMYVPVHEEDRLRSRSSDAIRLLLIQLEREV